jgi:hypothetical protein
MGRRPRNGPADPSPSRRGGSPAPVRPATADGWHSLQVLGGIAAILAGLVFRRWWSSELSLLEAIGIIHATGAPFPAAPAEWFALIAAHPFRALVELNLFDLVNYLLVALMYLGLFSRFRKARTAGVTLAMGLTLLGVALHLSSSQAATLFTLGAQFNASTADARRQLLLGAGQSALITGNPVGFGTGVFWSWISLYAAGLLLSLGMLRDPSFARWTGVLGAAASAIGLGYFFTCAFGPALSIFPAVLSAPCNLVWYVATGVALLRMARLTPPEATSRTKEAVHDE